MCLRVPHHKTGATGVEAALNLRPDFIFAVSALVKTDNPENLAARPHLAAHPL